MIEIRRSTALADARGGAFLDERPRVGRRPCATCPRVGVDEPRAKGPLSSPAFQTGATIAILIMAGSMWLFSGAF